MEDKEIDVIKNWTLDRTDKTYSQMRNYFRGQEVDGAIKEQAKILEDMFSKYDSELDKSMPLYRAIRFKKMEEDSKIIFSNILENAKDTGEIMIDTSPSSFSKSIDVAKKFGNYNDKRYYTVLFVAKNRKSSELDIEKYSQYPQQKEVLLQTHKNMYYVKSYSLSENKDVLTIEIEEV